MDFWLSWVFAAIWASVALLCCSVQAPHREWFSALRPLSSRAHRLRWCRHVDSVAVAPGREHTRSTVVVRPWHSSRHVGSSQIRDQAHAFCTGRRMDSLPLSYQGSPNMTLYTILSA